jgi:hypothetical protein
MTLCTLLRRSHFLTRKKGPSYNSVLRMLWQLSGVLRTGSTGLPSPSHRRHHLHHYCRHHLHHYRCYLHHYCRRLQTRCPYILIQNNPCPLLPWSDYVSGHPLARPLALPPNNNRLGCHHLPHPPIQFRAVLRTSFD